MENPGIAQAMDLRAMIYFNKGQDLQPFTKTDNQYEIKRAKEICDEVIKQFPKTEGGVNCYNLSGQIRQPLLNLEKEKVTEPNQPFRTMVTYKNAKNVYFSIRKTPKEDIKQMERRTYDKM